MEGLPVENNNNYFICNDHNYILYDLTLVNLLECSHTIAMTKTVKKKKKKNDRENIILSWVPDGDS